VKHGQTTYFMVPLQHDVALGENLTGGVWPGCDDVVVRGPDGRRVNAPPPDRPADLVRLRGVPAQAAVGVVRPAPVRPERTRVAFVAPGFITELRSHPLHVAIYGRRGAPTADCARPRRLIGRVRIPPGPPYARFTVQAAGGLRWRLQLVPGAAYRGPRRAGLPYVALGDRITASGLACASRVLVADALQVSGT
jgi:hypothetical protein